MNKMSKRILGLAMFFVMVVSFMGCGSAEGTETTTETTAETEGGDASDEVVIGICIPDMAPPFFGKMRDGFEEQAKKYGYTVKIEDGQNDAARQTSQVENFITEKVDMVILLPVATESLVPAAKELNEAGIPFITDNRTLVSEGTAADAGVDMVTYVGSNDYDGGRKMAELLIEALGTEGQVAMIDGVIGSSAQVMRSQGFKDYLDEQDCNIEIVAEETCNWDQNEAMTVTENFLTKFAAGELDAIVCQDPYGSVGIAQVVKDQGREELLGKIIGFDLPPELYDEIAAGNVYGAVVQSPYDQAALGIDVCHQYLTEGGDNIAENTYNDLPTVTINNVAESEPAW